MDLHYATGLAFGGLLVVGMIWQKTRNRKDGSDCQDEQLSGEVNPDRWVQVGRLKEIFLYPVKSGRWLQIQSALCTSQGVACPADLLETGPGLPLRDRFFVVYEEETGKFMSARFHPKMLYLETKVESAEEIKFSFPNQEDISLKFPLEQKEKKEITLWVENVPTVDCGPDIAEWISRAILMKPFGLRMGFWDKSISTRRDVKSTKYPQLYEKLRNEDTGAYSDLSSYLLINQTSIDDLNDRINDDTIFGALRFRPNFVIEGLDAYKEDELDWIKIGNEAVFRNFKPCTRCSLTTIDPFTGQRHPTCEPIRTLKQYRQLKDLVQREAEGNCPAMGVYIGLYTEGMVKVGDPIFALR